MIMRAMIDVQPDGISEYFPKVFCNSLYANAYPHFSSEVCIRISLPNFSFTYTASGERRRPCYTLNRTHRARAPPPPNWHSALGARY